MLNVDKFLDYLSSELNRSQQTVESYRDDLKHFEKFAKDLSDSFSWETVDSDMVRDWMESMMDKGNSAATVSRRLSALKTFYRFALARHYVESDPVYSIKGPKKEKPLPQFVKESEMDELLDRQAWGDDYNNVRARTIIILFYETGMRLSELVNLDDKDVNFVTSEIKITGKGNKQRIVPFDDELKNTLLEFRRLRDASVEVKTPALVVSDKGTRMSPSKVQNIVRSNLSRVCSLKKKSPHVLRHSFATAMLNHHVGIENLKKLLGHASISTTEIYTHTTFEQLKRVYNEAHPRA
ncbi:tyrosine-type recombinase/integrase [Prevotella copri]|uniref:site-specific tyrosine recombinase/integron integrase n=1 Tax=Segatella copri TaxID=165179 RepID=UPI001C37FB8C|nr:site-specific tyrosine recombinase/integron integrase [Segatella copri]MBV3428452.1 tyrosine-type recombinase/integrase [Segatella copri]